MTSYTEFNKDMFLCNNFDNASGVYSNGNTILSIPGNLLNATFYNYTEIKNAVSLATHHKDSLKNIIDPTNPSNTYDISSALYDYLKKNKKTYADFKKSDLSDTWIYTFGQLVKSEIKTDFDISINNIIETVSYNPTYS
jgi:hypothetical protein